MVEADRNSTGTNNTSSDVPLLFYSRRIGLANNRDVPIFGGGRVTGRIGVHDGARLMYNPRYDLRS